MLLKPLKLLAAAGLFGTACSAPVYEGLGEPDTTLASTIPTSGSTAAPGTATGATDPTSTDPTATDPGSTATSLIDPGSTDTTDTTESVESTGPPVSCGNAVLEPGEECDPGYEFLSDSGACTLLCLSARCGDGLVWEGEELCDHGANNNDMTYGGCSTQCLPGPACNDAIVQEPEECDAGSANGSGESPEDGVPCDSGCRFVAKLAFTSSAVYTGGELLGAEGAHMRCVGLAEQAGLDNAGAFRAFISDAGWSPYDDFIHTELPLVLPNGVRIADDWGDLMLNGPGDGIIVTETGEEVLDKKVWTGTAASGKALDPSQTCMGWTSSLPTDKGRIGRTGVDPTLAADWAMWDSLKQWVGADTVGCHLSARLYCVEQ